MPRTIIDIYDQYLVPEGLRAHMFRVAAIGALIAEAWTGPALRESSLLRVLLLHDMGNVVKMDDPALADLRSEFQARYGADDHEASQKIGWEVGLTPAELDLMAGKVFVRNAETLESDDYTRKVGAYADQRVSPQGVQDLMARLREAQERSKDKPGSSMNNPQTPLLIDTAARIEQQVLAHCRLCAGDINEVAVDPYVDRLRAYCL